MKFGKILKQSNLLVDGIRPPLTYAALKKFVKSSGDPEIMIKERTGQALLKFRAQVICDEALRKLERATLEEMAGLPEKDVPQDEQKRLNVSHITLLLTLHP